MVFVMRIMVYLLLVLGAALLSLLLRWWLGRSGKRGWLVPGVTFLISAGILLGGTAYYLDHRALVRKYTPFLVQKNKQRQYKRVFTETEVRICRPDGTEDRLFLAKDYITSRDMQWSPDGQSLVCARVHQTKDGMHLFLYDAEGAALRRLTSGTAINRRPSWSPDGSRLVFDSRESVGPQIPCALFTIAADGSDLQQLTRGEEMYAYHPVWSPDGGTIYFVVKENRRDDLWAMDASGGNLRQLTFTPEQSETEPAVSPDGALIAFSLNRRQIQLINADGSGRRTLVSQDTVGLSGRDPSWTPDGHSIYFSSFEKDVKKRSLSRINVDGSGLTEVPGERGKLLTPVVSPDGTRLVYLNFIKNVFVDVPGPTGTSPSLPLDD